MSTSDIKARIAKVMAERGYELPGAQETVPELDYATSDGNEKRLQDLMDSADAVESDYQLISDTYELLSDIHMAMMQQAITKAEKADFVSYIMNVLPALGVMREVLKDAMDQSIQQVDDYAAACLKEGDATSSAPKAE